jgi:hypothetical protein
MSKPLVLRLLLPLVMALPLAACEQLGVETPAQTSARQEAEGKAVGGACRHAGKALEDCYKTSPKTSKAAIYTGWRDMDLYMRENKIEVVPTQEAINRAEQKSDRDKEAEEPAASPPAEGTTDQPAGKPGAKATNKQS